MTLSDRLKPILLNSPNYQFTKNEPRGTVFLFITSVNIFLLPCLAVKFRVAVSPLDHETQSLSLTAQPTIIPWISFSKRERKTESV